MLTYFKINSEQALEWDEDSNDLSIFIVIVAAVHHEFGVSTFVLSNRKQQSAISSKFKVLGLSTVSVVSQFDVKIETGVECLREGMRVIGLNGLRAFIEAKRSRPFMYADLKRVMTAAEITVLMTAARGECDEECGTSDLNYPTFSP